MGGYEALRVCKKVQVLRPRVSTSGGQFEGISAGVTEEVAGLVPSFLTMAAQAPKEVQDRHLQATSSVPHAPNRQNVNQRFAILA